MKEYLLELRSDHRFKMILDSAKRARPSIPAWHPGMDPEEWKYRSGMQAGFDLALTFFGVSAAETMNE